MNSPDHSSSRIELVALGWEDYFSALFTEHACAGDVPARVVRVDRGGCDTLTATGPVRAVRGSGLVTDRERTVCTGDWVVLRRDGEPAQIVDVLPRRTAIARASSDRTSERQVLAANVDTVIIAVSVADRVNLGRIERFLTLAYDAGTRPVIALTKSDLVDDILAGEAAVGAVAPGAEMVATSTVSGVGIDLLASTIIGTAVLLGSSGAGKSSLANALLRRDRMAVNDIRSADGKGRHTTAHRELLVLPGCKILIDTPGLRGIGVQDVADAAGRTFSEIEELALDCGFRDCEHRSEPRCAVQEAIRGGRLDSGRLERYRKLLRESEWSAARGDAREASKRSKRDKAITRDIRAMYRFRDRQG
ncbi:ribosome small subunit-dependent GTPase A [Gordonia lacunae]|uniref:Small ribosomal subunit biogenesis GTPase RsgA n=1 Tax=Gordonia lacunae TaxID=417102 RepID=A0A243QF42_9ACTN|nr:ribosome small subunit-dependent GTPase A [Gordonia lacunae]OUC79413.1 ribosome small subunit-dependent GTPase A [Gordonia lacunae]